MGATLRIAILAQAAKAKAEFDGVGDSAKGMGDRVKASLGQLGGLAKGAALGAGVAIGGALLGGISQALEQGQLNAKLGAQLGLSKETAAKYGKISGQVYADGFGTDVAQVNEAIKGVYQNIGEGNAQWTKDITSQVLSVANTFEQDLGGTTAAVGQLLRTGLAVDAEEALDILTVGFQSGADKAGDLLDTFTEYGTQFRKFGLDGQTATGLLAQGLQAGARDADTVADAIKEFSIRAIDGSKTTSAGFKAIGLDAKQMAADIAGGGPKANAALDQTLDRLRGIQDPVARSAAAVALFGTKAEDLGDSLFALDPSSAVQALGQVEGAAGRVGEALGETAGAKIEKFKRGLTQGFVEGVGGAIGAIEGLTDVLVRGDFSTAFKDAFKVEEDSPLVDLLFRVRETVISLGQAVLTQIMPPLRSLWQTITNDLVPALAGWYAAILPIYVWLAEKLFPIIGTVFGAIVDIIRGALQVVTGIIQVATGILTGDWSKAWDGIKNILSGAWEIIKGVVRGAWAIVSGLFSAGVSGVVAIAKTIGSRILDAVSALGGLLLGWANSAWTTARNAFTSGVNGAVAIVRGVPGAVVSALGNLGSTLLGAGRQLMEGFARGISERIEAAVQKVRDGLNKIKGMLPGSPIKYGPLKSWNNGGAGKRLMGFLADGISAGAPTVSAALSDGITARAALRVDAGRASIDVARPSASAATAVPVPREPVVLELRSSGSRLDDVLLELLRGAIRTRGGNVQVVLGRG